MRAQQPYENPHENRYRPDNFKTKIKRKFLVTPLFIFYVIYTVKLLLPDVDKISPLIDILFSVNVHVVMDLVSDVNRTI